MANLIPEKRFDKNGVLTTKHVRDEYKRITDHAPLPAPMSPSKTKQSLVENAWEKGEKHWKGDKELEKVCSYLARDIRGFWCSDDAAYEVLSVVAPENVTPILATGVRTAADAQRFLESEGLPHLITDNRAMVQQAVAARIEASTFLDFTSRYPSAVGNPLCVDAAKAYDNKHLKQLVHRQEFEQAGPTLVNLVLNGEVRLSDINEIGPKIIKTMCLRENSLVDMFREADQSGDRSAYATTDNYLIDQLRALARGETAYSSAGELSLVLLNAQEDGGFSERTAIELAAAYGDGTAEVINANTWVVAKALTAVLKDRVPSERRKVLDYRLSIKSKRHATRETVEMFEAGVRPKNAAFYLESELTLEQTIALDRGDAEPSLIQGVL